MNKIGIIAGGGQFPLLFAEAAKRHGRQVLVVAHKGETLAKLADLADAVCWVKLGQLGKIIRFFRKEGVNEAVLLGTITKTRIFKDIMPDIKGLAMWNKLKVKHDDSILRAVAGAIEEEGIKILESTLYLKDLLFPKGLLTNSKPSAEQIDDVKFGWKMAREIGRLDIGQCVVVRDKAVLAVEAIEGTDAAIRRGGSLGKERAVVVKVKKPDQDFRFDLPAIGTRTIESMAEVGAVVLAVEAGQALLFDAETMIDRANRAGIAVIGVEERSPGELDLGL